MNYHEVNSFVGRHIGPQAHDREEMLNFLGVRSLDELMDAVIPPNIRHREALDMREGLSERELLQTARGLAGKNKIYRSFIGLGYYDTFTPPVVLRNVLENPGWYTSYTPYQAEVSQGRMEALLNFQTMIMDLTAMPIANASLLDEGTAAAEAMSLALHATRNKNAKKIFVSADIFPQTLEVVRTRATPLGLEVVVGDEAQFTPSADFFAALLQYPGSSGEVRDLKPVIAKCQSAGVLSLVAADLLALCVLTPPGEMGADIVVGSAQRFGVPFGFGGPHAGYIATQDEFKRMIPGRIIGVSVDRHGHPALRLALQTREQHIRREKATSNICTAQVLLAVMASMYAVYHGPKGLKEIAERVQSLTSALRAGLTQLGFTVLNKKSFDTLRVKVSRAEAQKILERAHANQMNFAFLNEDWLGISFDELTTPEDVEAILAVFKGSKALHFDELRKKIGDGVATELKRQSPYLQAQVFNSHRSESEMLRYIFRLQGKDLSLAHSMIPLGSCTMKLNSTAEMIPVTWPEFAKIHPFAPLDQTRGYLEMIHQLERWLAEITGFSAISLQPNAGSQGEYAGLLAIRKYHESRGQSHRNVCLIPSSAHGTNPASAVMAGMKVVVVSCDEQGNVDLNDLKTKTALHKDNLAALMITYPSTHGVFEESIREICGLIHDHGGQVYMDGANMNALVGVCKPGKIGVDVSHLNLHKTFAIPHGGGGPGVGPIGVGDHLKEFLPSHSLVPEAGPKTGIGATTSAPWGSAGVLPISWAYIAMMGRDGLKWASETAILNANYIAKKLEAHYPIVYKGRGGWIAHECILDVRDFKESAGLTVDDIAKRLMDYGFHAPTMSWPVAGTLMIEPTESESKEELDRFIDAMIAIREEIAQIERGNLSREDNMLKNAPHAYTHLLAEKWEHPYSREQAAFPRPWVKERKFWVPVGRVDNAYGDKNLVCSCLPLEEYQA